MSADLRAEFEAWARGKSLGIERDLDAWGHEKYKHSHVGAMWEGYLTAANATARRCVEMAEAEHDHTQAIPGMQAAVRIITAIETLYPDAFKQEPKP